ncbi:MAG TPA: hypothetical protein VFN35_19350 [Ktedonobacteraceae bacterium]|nr:hypothetical protein [Ktedonobacteraceae bacterium]
MQQQQTSTRVFTASEVAEFEYCPLTWWHEQFEPWAKADNEELFARLVELEHEHGAQAPSLPEYRMIEQLLLRHGAFEKGRQQHQEHAEAIADIEEEVEEELRQNVASRGSSRMLTIAALVLGLLAFLLLVSTLFLR